MYALYPSKIKDLCRLICAIWRAQLAHNHNDECPVSSDLDWLHCYKQEQLFQFHLAKQWRGLRTQLAGELMPKNHSPIGNMLLPSQVAISHNLFWSQHSTAGAHQPQTLNRGQLEHWASWLLRQNSWPWFLSPAEAFKPTENWCHC